MGSPVVVASPRKSPSYNRRANKPLVEKKRRARINGCLGQLKSLILGAMQTEGAQVSRLEKADILEMTVKYLRHVQSQQVAPEPEVVTKFSAGYTECASEVIRYIDAVNCVSPDVRAKLENHLVERLRGSLVQTPSQTPTPTLPTQQHQQQHMNPPTQYSHATFQPSQATSPAVNEIMYSHTANNVCDKVLSYQNDIDIANKAAAEALKRPTPVTSSPTRASVMGIRQTIQASPVSPKRPSSSSPKSDPQERNGQLFNQLTASRQETHVHQVLHPVPRLARSQSTSPLHVRHAADSVCMPSAAFTGERERHCSGGDQAMHVVSSHYTPAPSYTHAAYSPPAYGHEAYISNTADKQLNMSSAKSESENYFSDYERPLHIHIPDSPRIPPTPSPPFYHPGMSYHPAQPHESNALVSPRNTSCSSLDESPPTILYGYSQPRTASPAYKMETEEMTQYSSNRYSSRYSDYEQENVHAMMSYENAIDSRDHHQDGFQAAKRALTNTPSPPTLTREEPFIHHGNHPHLQVNHSQNDLYNERAQNAANQMQTQLCYMRESAHYTPPPQFGDQVYPAYRNHYSGHRDNQYCDQISHESNQRYSSDDVPSHQQHNSGHQSRPDVCNKPEPAPQPESRTPPHNEQPTMNGPAQPQPTVQSRQKDTSLSLLTLKRRILYGLGSEGEWTASGKTAGQQKCTQDNRADESETRALPCKERDLITPAAILCRSSTQCAADDTVWRPW